MAKEIYIPIPDEEARAKLPRKAGWIDSSKNPASMLVNALTQDEYNRWIEKSFSGKDKVLETPQDGLALMDRMHSILYIASCSFRLPPAWEKAGFEGKISVEVSVDELKGTLYVNFGEGREGFWSELEGEQQLQGLRQAMEEGYLGLQSLLPSP